MQVEIECEHRRQSQDKKGFNLPQSMGVNQYEEKKRKGPEEV